MKEAEKVKNLIKKLRSEGDITPDEADYIFVLTVITHSYTLGHSGNYSYGQSFYLADQDTVAELIEILVEWFKEVDERVKKYNYGNFITTVPSLGVCPPIMYYSHYDKSLQKILTELQDLLWENRKVKASPQYIGTNENMLEWLSLNFESLLFCDILCVRNMFCKEEFGKLLDLEMARYGIFGRLPLEEIPLLSLGVTDNNVEFVSRVKAIALNKIGVPMACIVTEEGETQIAYPSEYKDIIDAVVNMKMVVNSASNDYNSCAEEIIKKLGLQKINIPERNFATKEISYIKSMIDKIKSGNDISYEEADNIYMILKMCQSIKSAIRRFKPSAKKYVNESTKRVLDTLAEWYKTIAVEIKKKKSGNFLHTLPNPAEFDTNLYQTRKFIDQCLKELPKGPCIVYSSFNTDRQLGIPDGSLPLDVRKLKEDSSTCSREYSVNRYGFLERYGIKTKYIECDYRYSPDIFWGKVYFLQSNSIPCMVLRFSHSAATQNLKVGVRPEDYDKALKIFSISDEEIYHTATKHRKKRVNEIEREIQTVKERIKQAEEKDDDLILISLRFKINELEKEKQRMLHTRIDTETIAHATKIVYEFITEREESAYNDDWLEIDR